MGTRLVTAGFDTLVNPFGILYDPLSIAEAIQRCLLNVPISEHDLVFQNGLWHSWLHHGCFSRPSKEDCLRACNDSIAATHEFLQRCDTLIVSFGTAAVYRLLCDNRAVANCHKVPSSSLVRSFLSVDQIVETFRPIVEHWRKRVILTVSPIRYLSYGMQLNQVSKSLLLLACNQLDAFYFPAYEILVDELRDYRFYADDMVHPSPLAETIIWNRFVAASMDRDTQKLVRDFEKLAAMKAHRPFFPDSPEHQQHLQRVADFEQRLLAERQKVIDNSTIDI